MRLSSSTWRIQTPFHFLNAMLYGGFQYKIYKGRKNDLRESLSISLRSNLQFTEFHIRDSVRPACQGIRHNPLDETWVTKWQPVLFHIPGLLAEWWGPRKASFVVVLGYVSPILSINVSTPTRPYILLDTHLGSKNQPSDSQRLWLSALCASRLTLPATSPRRSVQ